MRKHLPKIELIIIALSSPIKVGLYKDGVLFEEIISNEKTSQVLPKIYNDLIKKYNITKIIFAKGPGSFMSIKLVYIFLKTLQIVSDIEVFASEGFAFSKNRPIKAMGNLYFVKENGKILLKKIEKKVENIFELPKRIDDIEYDENIEPLYILPAV